MRCLRDPDVVAGVRFARQHDLLLYQGRRPQHRRPRGRRRRAACWTSAHARRLGRPGTEDRPRPGRMPAGRRRPRDTAARTRHGPRLRLAHRRRRPDAGRRFRLPHTALGLDYGQRRRDGGRDRRRRVVRASDQRTPTSSGACAAVAAISVSSPASTTRYTRSAPRSSAGRRVAASEAPRCSSFTARSPQEAPPELTLVAMMRPAPPAPWLPKEMHGKPIVACSPATWTRRRAKGSSARSRVRHAGRRHPGRAALRADASAPRRHATQGAALLLEERVSARDRTRAVRQGDRTRGEDPVTALRSDLLPDRGALNEKLRNTHRSAIGAPATFSTLPERGKARTTDR